MAESMDVKIWSSVDDMPNPVLPDLSKLKENDLNEAYVQFWKEKKEEPEFCDEHPCVHVSEITYGTPRRDIIAPQMIPGLEAETGLCARAREVGLKPDRIWFVCKQPTRFAVKLDIEEFGEVYLIGSVDAWVWLPPQYGGPALIPLEKKTGQYRVESSYGAKKKGIAIEQGLIYSWLSRVGAFVIQHDARSKGDKYWIKHEIYRALWPEKEKVFVELIKKRVAIALEEREKGSSEWRKRLITEASLAGFHSRVGVSNLMMFF